MPSSYFLALPGTALKSVSVLDLFCIVFDRFRGERSIGIRFEDPRWAVFIRLTKPVHR